MAPAGAKAAASAWIPTAQRPPPHDPEARTTPPRAHVQHAAGITQRRGNRGLEDRFGLTVGAVARPNPPVVRIAGRPVLPSRHHELKSRTEPSQLVTIFPGRVARGTDRWGLGQVRWSVRGRRHAAGWRGCGRRESRARAPGCPGTEGASAERVQLRIFSFEGAAEQMLPSIRTGLRTLDERGGQARTERFRCSSDRPRPRFQGLWEASHIAGGARPARIGRPSTATNHTDPRPPAEP